MLKLKLLVYFFGVKAFSSNCFYVEPVEKIEIKSSCVKILCSSSIECVGDTRPKSVYCQANKKSRCPSADECLTESRGYDVNFVEDLIQENGRPENNGSNTISK